MNRDESIEKMKRQLDDWNARIDVWEGQMHEAQAAMKANYERQLTTLRNQREEGLRKFKLVQESSEAAWHDVGKGFEDGWKNIAEGFESACSEFRSKKNEGSTKS